LVLRNIKRGLVVGEKNVFHELSEILDLAGEANAIMTQMLLERYKGKPLTEATQAIRLLEKKSDDTAFKVSEDITSGAVSPNVLDDLLNSVQLADTLLDTYYNLSRELNRMAKAEFAGEEVNYKTDWTPIFEKMLSLGGKAITEVKRLFATSSLTEMIEVRKQIEALEEQGDDVKDAGFDKLYANAPGMHYLQFFHYSELLHKLDDILDACEDLSDTIVSIVNSILK
jgi:hypothetical protein